MDDKNVRGNSMMQALNRKRVSNDSGPVTVGTARHAEKGITMNMTFQDISKKT